MGRDMARPLAWGCVHTGTASPHGAVSFLPAPGPIGPCRQGVAPAGSADGDRPATQLPDDLTLPQPRRPVTGGRGLGTASAEQVLGVGELGDQLADRRGLL